MTKTTFSMMYNKIGSLISAITLSQNAKSYDFFDADRGIDWVNVSILVHAYLFLMDKKKKKNLTQFTCVFMHVLAFPFRNFYAISQNGHRNCRMERANSFFLSPNKHSS